MPEPVDSSAAPEPSDEHSSGVDVEAVEGELVDEQLAEVRRLPVRDDGPGAGIERRRASLPAVAVAATGGFAIGVAAFLALRILRRPAAASRLARRSARLLGRDKGLEVQASRSFLVDVHMLKR